MDNTSADQGFQHFARHGMAEPGRVLASAPEHFRGQYPFCVRVENADVGTGADVQVACSEAEQGGGGAGDAGGGDHGHRVYELHYQMEKVG